MNKNPVAYMFTDKKDTFINKICFSPIKQKIGKIIIKSNTLKKRWNHFDLQNAEVFAKKHRLSDADAFCAQLQVAINNIIDDVDTKIIGKYFFEKLTHA